MFQPIDRRQKWLGVIALCVCGAILFSLLLPAIDCGGREPARMYRCRNNLKELALATIRFEMTQKQYPGIQAGYAGGDDGRMKIGAWVVSLLPLLEHQALRDLWDDPSNREDWISAVKFDNDEAKSRFYPSLGFLRCPSDSLLNSEYGGMSYAANAGFYLLPNDPALGLATYSKTTSASERSANAQRSANGLFANHLGPNVTDPISGMSTTVFGFTPKRTSSGRVRDGSSQTLAFSENMNNLNWQEFSISDDSSRFKLGLVWLYAGDTASLGRPMPQKVTAPMRFNHNKLFTASGPMRARPSGNHAGGMIASFADGSIRKIDEDIDYRVYQSLMAPHDAMSDIPDLSYTLKEEDNQDYLH